MACFGKSSTDDDALVHRLHDLTLERDALKTRDIASTKELARLSALLDQEGQSKATNGAKVKKPKKKKKGGGGDEGT